MKMRQTNILVKLKERNGYLNHLPVRRKQRLSGKVLVLLSQLNMDQKFLSMAKTINQRMTVKLEGDFVVFLIGMRINKFWKIHKWLPVARAMPRMLKELSVKDRNETGFLGAEFSFGTIVQY